MFMVGTEALWLCKLILLSTTRTLLPEKLSSVLGQAVSSVFEDKHPFLFYGHEWKVRNQHKIQLLL